MNVIAGKMRVYPPPCLNKSIKGTLGILVEQAGDAIGKY